LPTTIELSGHTGEILALKFNPFDPFILASAASDKTIRIWNAYEKR
jgi:WD40 repeat protein